MEMRENESSVVVLNEQPEFSTEIEENYDANYFILCEESDSRENFCESKVAGMSLLDWVSRACETKPIVIKVGYGDDAIQAIKPYLGGAEYSVVLYASTPLVTKRHLKDLLGFVGRKRMNACKLKKGYVFRNEYISGVDEIYSIDTYDFASNDFFEVKTNEDLTYVQNLLIGKIVSYHRRNGVYFENSNLVTIDANVNIGSGTKIASGVSALNNSTIGENVVVFEDVVISGSKIGENVVLYPGVKVIDSVIKDGAVIGENTVIKKSVIFEDVKVGVSATIIDTGVKTNSVIENGAFLDKTRIDENVTIQKGAKIIGENEPSVVLAHSIIGSGATVIGAKLAECSKVASGVTVSGKAGE